MQHPFNEALKEIYSNDIEEVTGAYFDELTTTVSLPYEPITWSINENGGSFGGL